MRVLALDTTTRAGSVAIVDGGVVLDETVGDAEQSHTVRLPLEIDRALARSALTLDDIDVFAVASGPGSFTGMRTGIATIQGLAMVKGKRVVAVSALEALAESQRPMLPAGARVGAWMDAFRKDVFSALYEVPAETTADLLILEDASVEAPAAVWQRWTAIAGSDPNSGSDLLLVGDGAVRYEEIVSRRARIVAPPPLAAAIARIASRRAARGDSLTPGQLHPLYVRRPDVEVARDLRAARPPESGTP